MEKVTARDIEKATAAAVGRSQPLIYIAAGVYVVLTVFALRSHEPWADEAQSWLLARDASLRYLWASLAHYEGTPGLWQTLIHGLIRLGLPYSAYGFVSATLSLAGVCLLLRYAPLPIFVRAALPFTYFLCYQYAVIARSYALIAPLLFAVAAIYPQRRERPVLMTVLLALLAGVSAHGFLVSACIWIVIYAPMLGRGGASRKKILVAGVSYLLILVFFLVSAWPAKDGTFADHRGLANLRLLPEIAKAGLAAAFTGYWIPTLAVIALSAPFLWRGGGWLIFLLATASLCLFGAAIYAQLWHFGIVFLVWIFAMWISAYNTRLTTAALAALIAAIAFQCYWTGAAVLYDWRHPYSGSAAAAEYLRESGIASKGIYAVGFPSVAVQPYFRSNIYSDYRHGYWDWSSRNTAGDPGALLASPRREFVLVGYKNALEKRHWADLLALLGYRETREFNGGTFWETRVFEFESYDLYEEVSPPHVEDAVDAADPAQGPLFLSGFYGIEGKSRWTARRFSVLLNAADRRAEALNLEFYIPDIQMRNLGPITIRASIAGRELAPQTFSSAGSHRYSARVAPDALRGAFVIADFRLDKSSEGRYADARDLGIVVTRIGLSRPR